MSRDVVFQEHIFPFAQIRCTHDGEAGQNLMIPETGEPARINVPAQPFIDEAETITGLAEPAAQRDSMP